MRPKQFTLSSVKTTPTASLLLRYADGEQFEVSLVDTIKQHPTLERLQDPKVFSSAKVGDHGARRQRIAHRLALRIEHAGLQRDMNLRAHRLATFR